MSRSHIVFNGPRFMLETAFNGLTYTLTHKSEGMDVFLQGDEANHFRHELDEASRAFPQASHDDIASWLWDQCCYGDAALPVTVFEEA